MHIYGFFKHSHIFYIKRFTFRKNFTSNYFTCSFDSTVTWLQSAMSYKRKNAKTANFKGAYAGVRKATSARFALETEANVSFFGFPCS